MKKLFSQKVGLGLAAAALVAGSAYAGIRMYRVAAEPENADQLWVMPTQEDLSSYEDGTQVAFITKSGDHKVKVLSNAESQDPQAIELSTDAGVDYPAFTLRKDGNYLTFYTGELNDDDYSGIYLKANDTRLTVEQNDLKNEVRWTVKGSSNCSVTAMNSGGNIYFDSEGKYKISTSESNVSAFIKATVYRPTFTVDNSVTPETMETEVANTIVKDNITYLRYAESATSYTKPSIIISAEENENSEAKGHYSVEYKIGDGEWTDANATSDTIDIKDLDKDQAVEIQTRTAVKNAAGDVISEGTVVSQTYYVVYLDDPELTAGDGVWNEDNSIVTADNECKASCTVGANEETLAAGTAVKVTYKRYVGTASKTRNNNTAGYITEDLSEFVDVAADQTVKLQGVYLTKNGFQTIQKTFTFTLKPYYTKAEAEGFFDIKSDPEAGTRVAAGETIVYSAEKLATVTKSFNVASTQATDLKFVVVDTTTGDTISAAADYEVDGDTYMVTIPTTVDKFQKVTVTVPAGAFVGTDDANMEAVNNVAKDFAYGSEYLGQTFIAQKTTEDLRPDDMTTVYIDDQAAATAQFKIYSGTIKNPAIVESTLSADYAKVTRTDGKEITASYTITSDGDGKFTVTFDENPGVGTYLIMFPAGTLVDGDVADRDNTHTNMYNVSAYLDIKEYAEFSYVLVDAKGDTITDICEKNPVYLKVTTDTKSHQHPSFVVPTKTDIFPAGTYNSGAIFKIADKASDIATPAWNGVEYTKEVLENIMRANNNVNAGDVTDPVKVYTHVTFAGQTPAPEVDKNAASVEFTLTAKDSKGNNLWSDVIGAKDMTVKVDGKEAALKITSEGVATLTLPEGLAAGPYKIEFAKNDFVKNTPSDPCQSNAFTQNVTLSDVTFTFAKVEEISEKDFEFNIESITAKLGNNKAIDAEFNAEAKIYNGETEVGTINDGKVTLKQDPNDPTKNILGAGVYTLTVGKDAYAAYASKNAGTETFILKVHSYVTYSIEEPNSYITESKKGTVVTFKLRLAPAYDAIDDAKTAYVPTFNTKLATKDITGNIALQDGGNTYVPTMSEATATDVPGVYEFTATFPDVKLAPNNYVLNIDKNGVGGTNVGNNNDTDLFVKFQVYKVVDFKGTETYAKAAKTVSFLGQAIDEELVSRSAEIAANTADWKVTKDGEPFDATVTVDTTEPCDTAVTFIITPKSGTMGIGEYKVTAPAGTETVDASKNAEIVYTIHVVNVAFAIVNDDVTVNRSVAEDLAWAKQASWTVLAYTVDANGEPIDTLSSTITADLTTKTTLKAKTSTVANAWDYADNVITAKSYRTSPEKTEGLSVKYSPYTLTVNAGELSTIYQGLEFTNAKLTATVKVVNVFDFVNNVAGEATTLNDELVLPEGVETTDVHYTQDLAGYREAISLPFDMPYDQISDMAVVSKINMVYKDAEGVTYFVLVPLADGDIMYANKPYVIESAHGDASSLDVTIKDVPLTQAVATSISCATTLQDIDFKNTYTVNAAGVDREDIALTAGHNVFSIATKDGSSYSAGDLVYIDGTKNAGKVATAKIWGWYATTTDKADQNYVKMVVLGEDEATAIMNIASQDENAVIYNVAGQKLNRAHKGVNIINGKKVLVK